MCPAKISPWAIGTYSTGARWYRDSCCKVPLGDYRKVAREDMYQSPRGVGTNTRLATRLWWS